MLQCTLGQRCWLRVGAQREGQQQQRADLVLVHEENTVPSPGGFLFSPGGFLVFYWALSIYIYYSCCEACGV